MIYVLLLLTATQQIRFQFLNFETAIKYRLFEPVYRRRSYQYNI